VTVVLPLTVFSPCWHLSGEAQDFSAAMASYRYDAIGVYPWSGVSVLRSKNLAHGIVEGKAKDLDKEVDGVSALVLLGPPPIGVFDDQPLVAGEFQVARGEWGR
jgi:hypothetical protein